MKRTVTVSLMVIFVLALLVLTSRQTEAYPYFARKLMTNCGKCHMTSFPVNNAYGSYVKSTGYELPDVVYDEESLFKRLPRLVPISFRVEMDFYNSDPENLEGEVNFREVQIISGGSVLENRVSWWFHKHIVEDNEWVSLFDGNPHEMWGQYNLRFGEYDKYRVNGRYGMSELPLAFSPSKTMLSEIPYSIYNAVIGENTFNLSMSQYGVYLLGTQLGGTSFNKVRSQLALGLVNGTGDFDSHDFTQVFGRVSFPVKMTSVGLFAFRGSMKIEEMHITPTDEHGDSGDGDHGGDEHGGEGDHNEPASHFDNDFFRVGVDIIQPITKNLSLCGLGLYASDDRPFTQTNTSASFYGGFLGLDFIVGERLLFQVRYDLVRFNDLPTEHAEEGGEEHGEAGHAEETSAADEHAGGHVHGGFVTENTDAMIFGIHYVPFKNFGHLRISTELRRGFKGVDDLFMLGTQFAL